MRRAVLGIVGAEDRSPSLARLETRPRHAALDTKKAPGGASLPALTNLNG